MIVERWIYHFYQNDSEYDDDADFVEEPFSMMPAHNIDASFHSICETIYFDSGIH